jgi:hypothetical protein
MVSLKIATAIMTMFTLIAIFQICIDVLLFGNASDNSSFFFLFQAIWTIAALIYTAATLDGIFAYDRWTDLARPLLEQAGKDPNVIMEEFAKDKTKSIISQVIVILLLVSPILLCTFFILFQDGKNDPQWMMALLVFWCIQMGLIGLILVLGCCACCCLCLLKTAGGAPSMIPEDTSSETRPFANQSTTSYKGL